MTINNASIRLYSLALTEKKTLRSECNILSIVIKKINFSQKWRVVGRTAPVVGRTAPVVGRRPNMPYLVYATSPLGLDYYRKTSSRLFFFCFLVGLRVMCLCIVRFMYGKRGLFSIVYWGRFCILQFLRHFSRSWYVLILRVMKLEEICRDGVRWTLLF